VEGGAGCGNPDGTREPSTSLHLDDVTINARVTGVLHSDCYNGNVKIRGSRIHGATHAAVLLWTDDGSYDLGRRDDAGRNALTTDSGIALRDVRSDFPVWPLPAVGITLNGRTYRGEVTGPVVHAPDYEIVDNDGAIDFGPDPGP
jgi:hypothetical protein